jgi:hypothetical protein
VELGFVELLVASKAFNLFFASATNFPLGYCCKYALKSSGSVLVLIESQKAISSAEALPDGEAFVRLVRAGGVVFLDGGVAFFAGAAFFVDGKVAFGSCVDLAWLTGRSDVMKSMAIAQSINAKIECLRNSKMLLFIYLSV